MVAVASRPTARVLPATSPAGSAGALIDQLWLLREQKKELEAKADAIGAEMKTVEAALVERMDADGLIKGSGKRATLSFTYQTVADVQGDEGWKAFYAFIAKHKYFHLLHKRVSDAAYKEVLVAMNGGGDVDVFKAKKQVPGVLPFINRRVNLRTISS